ncbi:hypothetical protein Gogos_012258 [Gossypium gossypioides]|uniref:Armadillo-like repeats domain-containing protein n=1 Tax=Gossypium gossypioides TaxID=34282 RepID=A0A7J9BRY8_GOSGO|nr:hypothetical protein [Gossypium gossypioides]
MASIASSSSSSSSSSFTFTASSPFLSRPKLGTHPFPPALLSIPRLTPRKTPNLSLSLTTAAATSKSGGENAVPSKNPKETKKEVVEEEEVEVEEELPWIQEKALDLVEFTGSVTQAIPGPRVGTSSLPWILAVPLAYAGITFVIALVKTVKKFTSPRHQRKKLVNKNAMLCKSIDELFQQGSDAVDNSALKGLVQKVRPITLQPIYIYIERERESSQEWNPKAKLLGLFIFLELLTGFSVEEILRKYIRYSLNEKPWSADLISSLIQLRKASMLDDSQIAEILNDISRRIVREKGNFYVGLGFKVAFDTFSYHSVSFYVIYLPGSVLYPTLIIFLYCSGPVVMDMSGFTEKGFKRKLAVQGLFGKVLYLSELPEFCSRDSSLIVKEIFGVTDEDADKLRLHTFSEAGDMDSLEKMVDGSNSEDSHEDSADAV